MKPDDNILRFSNTTKKINRYLFRIQRSIRCNTNILKFRDIYHNNFRFNFILQKHLRKCLKYRYYRRIVSNGRALFLLVYPRDGQIGTRYICRPMLLNKPSTVEASLNWPGKEVNFYTLNKIILQALDWRFISSK